MDAYEYYIYGLAISVGMQSYKYYSDHFLWMGLIACVSATGEEKGPAMKLWQTRPVDICSYVTKWLLFW